ncbi:TIGR01777 family oxidoreductase [Marinomonas mediterranea]|uniref:TIGR01777 family oxidoreductase n=1 Tax=Marinomonas mediterranea TaxID=119864 RepID=UPI00234B9D50|nr:TIGR01777 family oxidoreductase [Marinomonas mediterranea]WCN09369.1 TIGR01777 family protein [Marinomonas mediterranea]WCN13446.1 TIGR01777 family protein [Marinomonas mediterranea]
MNILITGCTGFVGRELIKALLRVQNTTNTISLYGLVRRKNHNLEPKVKPITLDQIADHSFDVLINLAGESIAEKRWSESRKRALYESRVSLTEAIYERMNTSPKVVISMSAVGYYGYDDSVRFSEETPPKGGFTHDLCRQWEQSALAFESKGSRVCVLRLGVVLGCGGALQQMLIPYKLCLGGKIGTGAQGFPWVHIDDASNVIVNAISDDRYTGSINLVAPEQVNQAQFAKSFAKSLNRPILMPTPAIALKMLFGEMSELLTKGQFVLPNRLEKIGYSFKYDTLDSALVECSKHLSFSKST